jgi:N-ethylmaleimide reductase
LRHLNHPPLPGNGAGACNSIGRVFIVLVGRTLGLRLLLLEDWGALRCRLICRREHTFRKDFDGVLVLSGGHDTARAENDPEVRKADLIAVGRPLLANPDWSSSRNTVAPLNPPDTDTFYTPGAKGLY